jgi:tetratricopeptide (TPR) repeat protein
MHVSSLWPGLPRLWNRGETYSLAIAILFGVLLNLAILATFYWIEWWPSFLVYFAWCSLCLWSISSWGLSFIIPHAYPRILTADACDRLLATAQADYLRGEYIEAEASLHKILSAGVEDIEAALLLAAIFRRTGRKRHAIDCLERLERLDGSRKWYAEIENERKLLAGPASAD